jgi:hypothetical protein
MAARLVVSMGCGAMHDTALALAGKELLFWHIAC